MRLLLITSIPIKIKVKTGLHIGAGRETLRIGEIDNPVVKLHLKDNQPFIPGSSLKGKLRSLLELQEGNFSEHKGNYIEHKFNPATCLDTNGKLICKVCKFFGTSGDINLNGGDNNKVKINDFFIPRLIFRDLELDERSAQLYEELLQDPYQNFYEEKKETKIDRKTGRAAGGTLRETERVPAGVTFEGTMGLRVFDTDLEMGIEKFIEELKELLKNLTELLNNDYLGGSGTRGYGQVELEIDLSALDDLKDKLSKSS